MGNSSTQQQHSTTKYIQTLQDDNFGQVDIFKNEQGKYIMKLTRTFMKDTSPSSSKSQSQSQNYIDRGFHQILHFITTHPQYYQQFITPILFSESKQQNLCVVYEIIDTYCQYYNFTLQDMIKYKKQMDKQEIWLTFYWMVRFIRVLEERGWGLQGGIMLNRIFLTLKGMPTVSIHHLVKSSDTDQVFEKQSNFVQEVCLNILQLACMTKLSLSDNLELYLRKAQKIDTYLGEILGSVLRKSVSNKSKKIDQKDIQDRIQQLLAEQKISISKQIKLNKFKYIIPKTPSTPLQQPFKSQKDTTKQKPSPSISSSSSQMNIHHNHQPQHHQQHSQQSQQNQKPIIINSLGRKNKQNSSLRSSKKRQNILQTIPMLDLIDRGPVTKLFAMETPINANMNMNININMNSSINTNKNSIASNNSNVVSMNKTMSVKNALLMDDIQNRKRQTQRQIQKMWERKQMIMKTTQKLPQKTTQKQQKSKNQKSNKQNLLGNSIRQIRPSYSRKQTSWSKKVLNDHINLKQSNHRS